MSGTAAKLGTCAEEVQALLDRIRPDADYGVSISATTLRGLLAEHAQLTAQIAELGQPTTEWGVQERPGDDTTEYCGFSDASLREHASRTPLGRVMWRTAYRGGWHLAD